MRGHLESRGKGIWRAKVYLGRDANDLAKKRYLTRTVHGTKRYAEDVLAEMLVEAGHAGSNIVSDGTVADLAHRWFSVAGATLSPTTMREYKRLMKRRIDPRFGTTRVRALRTADLDAFYADLHRTVNGRHGLSARSVQQIHAVIRRLLNQGVKWGWLTVNPALNATPPRVYPHELNPPSRDQVVRLLDEAASRDADLACFLLLAVVTGARRGELCAVRWSDVDFNTRTLTIARSIIGDRNDELLEKDTKSHAARRVALDAKTLLSVEEHRTRCADRSEACDEVLPRAAYIFSDEPDGSRPWRPGRASLAFDRLCRQLSIDNVRLHDLRHFTATQLLTAGVPVKTVSGRLGHANAATTLNVYAHFMESSDEDAAETLRKILTTPERSRR